MITVIKLFLLFGLIIFLIRKIDIGLAMAIGSVILAVLYLIHPLTFGRVVIDSITDLSTLNIAFALLFIMFLAGFMKEENIMKKMVSGLEAIIKDARMVMAMLPAIIGFIPIPGGALFTCPLVEEAQKSIGLSAEKKSYINFWYRHIWEFILPVYPGTILTMEIFEIPYQKLLFNMYPFTILAIVVGIPIAFRGISNDSARHKIKSSFSHVWDLIQGIAPVLVAVLLVLVVKLPLAISLISVIFGLLLIHRYSFSDIASLFKESFTYKPISLVLGVILFKNVLIESGSVENLAHLFTEHNLPTLPVFYILPFFVGILTGNVTGVVGATFPILLGLLPSGEIDMRLVGIAFVSGFSGVMITPVHLCLTLTVQYFRATLEKVIMRVVIGEVAMICLATILYFWR